MDLVGKLEFTFLALSHPMLQHALGKNLKAKITNVLYVGAIVVAFFLPAISYVIFAVVAIMWAIPDKRIVAELQADHHSDPH